MREREQESVHRKKNTSQEEMRRKNDSLQSLVLHNTIYITCFLWLFFITHLSHR